MVCFAVPLVTAVITSVIWKVQDGGPAGWWLNLLLYGGALFGVVDHIWFGEFLLGIQQLFNGTAPMTDVILGFAITGAIFGGWGLTLGVARMNPAMGRRMGLVEMDGEL